MERHKRKNRQRKFVQGYVGAVAGDPNASRGEKIKAIRAAGYSISDKANSSRVDSKFREVYDGILEEAELDAEMRKARNKRRNKRKAAGK